MLQDTMPALAGLDSFEQLDNLLAARRLNGSPEAMMTFEDFEVELAQAMRRLENELKAADLARYDVDAEAIMVNGQLWRKCLAHQPKTYLSASGPITVSRNLYRPVGGGQSICPLELRAGIIGGLHTLVLARQDEEGHRLDTVRYGRAPESKKKTLTAQLDAVLSSILAVRPDLTVVAIADGAEENWRNFDRPLYAHATRIIAHGHSHACEHLHEAMSAYYGGQECCRSGAICPFADRAAGPSR